ncbi:hypothetical protein ACKLNO_06110 [Neisseriaceae bacterium B1]
MNKWLILAAAVSLAACGGNSNKISQSDLEEALEKSPRSNAVCVPFSLEVTDANNAQINQLTPLGSPEIRLLKRLPNGKRANEAAAEQMEILVDAEIYDDVGVTNEGSGEHVTRYLTYRLTEKGQRAFKSTPHGQFLCIGKLDVKKINYYTEPTPSNGVTTTQVSFDAKIKAERWAKKLLKNSPYYEGLDQTETRTATLVKTNKGWRDIYTLQ